MTPHLNVGKKQALKVHTQLIAVEVSKSNWIVWGRKIYEWNFSCSFNWIREKIMGRQCQQSEYDCLQSSKHEQYVPFSL